RQPVGAEDAARAVDRALGGRDPESGLRRGGDRAAADALDRRHRPGEVRAAGARAAAAAADPVRRRPRVRRALHGLRHGGVHLVDHAGGSAALQGDVAAPRQRDDLRRRRHHARGDHADPRAHVQRLARARHASAAEERRERRAAGLAADDPHRQAELAAGVHPRGSRRAGLGTDRDLAIEAMNGVLGGTFTARVNMNLRESKGWAYGARTTFQSAMGDRPFLVYAPVQIDRTGDSIAELIRELEAIKTTMPVTQDEMQRVIAGLTRELPGRFETSAAVLGSLI